MIEWLVVALIMSPGDPTNGIRFMVKTSETHCREMAARLQYGQEFDTVVDGVEVAARFEFCVWSKDGVIKDYVRHDQGSE